MILVPPPWTLGARRLGARILGATEPGVGSIKRVVVAGDKVSAWWGQH